MNRIQEFLVADWRRKLVALFFAVLLWGWLVGRIEVERDVLLRVGVAAADGATPEEFELLVQVPDGWALIDPEPGTAIPIHLVGTPSMLQDFTARQCAARIQAAFNAAPDQDRIDLALTPGDLDWLRPNDAAYLLRNVDRPQELRQLSFERVLERDLVLTQREQPVIGEPSSVHMLHPEEMTFTPTQVNIRGPKSAVTSLIAEIDAAYTAEGNRVDLLSPLVVPPNTRGDISAVVHLHSDLADLGLRMDPPDLLVSLPVRLAQPVRVEWLPSPTALNTLSPPADAGEWTVEPWTPTTWVAVLPDLPTGSSVVTEAWVREHVVLVLPLNTLGPDSLDRTELDLVPVLTGLSPEEQRSFAGELLIEPLDPDGWTVIVTRNP